ncbi:hypothetical protein F7U66_00295 [Vibrio parahaemolyticus]|nr:hypothetical protein [Vibrio parahaemolyticus]
MKTPQRIIETSGMSVNSLDLSVRRKALKEDLEKFFDSCRAAEEDSPRQISPDMSWLYPLIKKTIVSEMLVSTHGNQSKASRKLGIHRATLRTMNKIVVPE